jgi:hypothetical protein
MTTESSSGFRGRQLKGSIAVKVVPSASVEVTEMVPPWALMR